MRIDQNDGTLRNLQKDQKLFMKFREKPKPYILCCLSQGLLNRWTSQLDLGITAGGLERAVSVHNST